MHRISQAGLDFIKGFESFVPYVYDDLVPAQRVGGRLVYREWQGEPVRGTLTIGYGHTNAAKHPLRIRQGLRITEELACEILDVDLDECEQAVNDGARVPITQGQFDALVSFTFNCGAGNLKNLLARLNRGDYAATRAAFDLYVKSKGVTLRGLQRRRDGEQELWDMREVALPPEPVDHPAEVDPGPEPPPSSMATSSEGNTAVVVGGGGVGGVAIEGAGAMGRVAAKGTPASWDAFLIDFLMQLLSSPTFWLSVITTLGAAYIWLRRRARLLAEGV